MKLQMSHYDYSTNAVVSDGEVDTRSVAKALDAKSFAALLDDYCNAYSASFERGRQTGNKLQETHRTLQRSVIVELCGVIAGLGDQLYTDDRNRKAIELAKKIAQLCADEGFGPFV